MRMLERHGWRSRPPPTAPDNLVAACYKSFCRRGATSPIHDQFTRTCGHLEVDLVREEVRPHQGNGQPAHQRKERYRATITYSGVGIVAVEAKEEDDGQPEN